MNNAEFKTPSVAWRGKPFWSWNGDLAEEELLRQIHIMQEMGFGGYFMHSRTGLITEYLGEKWFKLINRCAEEGAALGMESWLYDEDRWPSGTAGGMVTENPEYRMKYIHLEIYKGEDIFLSKLQNQEGIWLGAWSCRLENNFDIFDLEKITAETDKKIYRDKSILSFRIIPMAEGPFYNGNTYVDTMKKEATEEYLRITHEAYKEHCGKHFGTAIKGIFTDEPHRGSFMSGFSSDGFEEIDPTYLIPWSEALFDAFDDRFGLRVEEQLPQLFLRYEGQKVSQVKAQYAEILLTLFIDNFAKPCYEWCEENNLQLTGHVLHENNFSCQVSTNGSVQRYYPHMHLPGVDVLGEPASDYWLVKQLDSTARQFGQKRLLSELYGCTGWHLDFQQHKAIGAWQALFGINLRCHHLSWYTMLGQAKRDFPASILHQSPWYKEYDVVESWFARMGYFRSLGNPVCNLLVINPVESVWGRVYPGAINRMDAVDEGIQALEEKYAALFHFLAGNQIDFDYGDEGILEEHGCIESAEKKLRIGEMQYRCVLVAGMSTVRSSTIKLLQQFQEAGGVVVFAGDAPQYLDSAESSTAAIFSESCLSCDFEEQQITDILRGNTEIRLQITDAASGLPQQQIFSQLRSDDTAEYLTILNTNREETLDITINLATIYSTVETWNLDDGEGRRITAAYSRGHLLLETVRMNPSEVKCFRFVTESELEEEHQLLLERQYELQLPDACAYSLSEENIVVFDSARWCLDGEELSDTMEILKIDSTLRGRLGVNLRAGNMVQPWFRQKEQDSEQFPVLGKLELQYTIEITDDVLSSLMQASLALENPEHFSLSINDRKIDLTEDCGFWVDIAFRKFSLPDKLFHTGSNLITISCDFSENINLEAWYLLGDFSVSVTETGIELDILPDAVFPKDLVSQGFPFYSGSFSYHYKLPESIKSKEVTIRILNYCGAYIKLLSSDAEEVKGKGQSKMLPWLPAETDMVLGDNLTVEVSITRKNTFGPLHNPAAHTGEWVGPDSFVTTGESFSMEPFFIASGLLEPIVVRYSDDAEKDESEE